MRNTRNTCSQTSGGQDSKRTVWHWPGLRGWRSWGHRPDPRHHTQGFLKHSASLWSSPGRLRPSATGHLQSTRWAWAAGWYPSSQGKDRKTWGLKSKNSPKYKDPQMVQKLKDTRSKGKDSAEEKEWPRPTESHPGQEQARYRARATPWCAAGAHRHLSPEDKTKTRLWRLGLRPRAPLSGATSWISTGFSDFRQLSSLKSLFS
jgi:hypothetical protein